MSGSLTAAQVQHFRATGVVHPIRALDEAAARSAVPQFDALRERMTGWTNGKQLLKSHLVAPWVNELVRHPAILDAVESLLGPDILCWTATFFAKPAHTPGYVGWHQDITYWGLEPADQVVTAWLALSDAHRDNGCMCVVAGTHDGTRRQHDNIAGTDNMLMAAQEVTLSAAEQQRIVDVELEPGEFSVHHSLALHGSHGNLSDRPRIGLSINYIATAVRQTSSAARDSATLVRGADRYGHFDLEPRPERDFDAAALAAYRRFIRSASGAGDTGSPYPERYIQLEAIA